MPEAVTSPGVEATVVTGLSHGVKDVAEVDEMATKGSFTEVNTCTSDIVDRAVADGDALCHRDLNPCGLFLNRAQVMDQAVIDDAVRWVVV